MTLLMTTGSLTIAAGAVIFLVITLILVGALLAAKAKLVPSGNVDLKVNGEKDIETPIGSTLLAGLQSGGIFLSSACGGGGKCGQCRAQVLEGGGEILPTEKGFFSRKQIKEHWRLACQCKVKEDMVVQVPDEVFGVKEWECEVISNKNVATFIKEFIVALPKGEHMDFLPGSYAQIKIPAYAMDYNKDIDKSLIGEEYLPAWEKFGLFTLKCKNDTPTIRAYSMANYPAEGDRIMLTVRIATPPFKPKPEVGFQDVMPGIASSYIFTLKPGDKVTMSGPYGDFHPIFDSKREMMWWCRYGSASCSDHAHDEDTQDYGSQDVILLWRPCLERSVLSGRFPGNRKGIPELHIPSGTRPSGSGSRCGRSEVHGRFRSPSNLRYISEGSRSSGRYRILHVWSGPDVKGSGKYAGQSGRAA